MKASRENRLHHLSGDISLWLTKIHPITRFDLRDYVNYTTMREAIEFAHYNGIHWQIDIRSLVMDEQTFNEHKAGLLKALRATLLKSSWYFGRPQK
jgi:hypothetical protein